MYERRPALTKSFPPLNIVCNFLTDGILIMRDDFTLREREEEVV